MLLKTSFEAERDEGSDCASLPLSVSNSAKIESSITVESTSGTRITVLMSRTILSTRTTSVKGSNSGASNCNVYSPVLSFDSILTDENYEYLRKAKEWIQSIEDRLIIFDSGLSARILYKTTIPILQKLGKIEEIDGREIYIPNNPNQKVIGVIDHALLLKLEEGRKIKEEIDLTSSYMVTLKRKYRISWFMIIQQNRESSSMDRRKADLSEPGLNDIMASSAPVNDSDVTLQIFYPAREKLSTCRGYKILGENGGGLRDTYRGLIISKNRYGIANQVLNCGFYGSVGWWTELPLPEQITDIKLIREPSLNIPCKTKRIIQQDLSENDIDKKIIRTNTEYTF